MSAPSDSAVLRTDLTFKCRLASIRGGRKGVVKMSGGACAVNWRAARPSSVGRRRIKQQPRNETMLFAFSAKGHAGADTRCCQRRHPARWTGAKLQFQWSRWSELCCSCGASQGTS